MAKSYPLLKLVGLGKKQDTFIENLSILISSGVDINSALESIRQENNSWALRYFIKILLREIENGVPLWRACAKTGVFPDHAISLIRIGEESESLANNLLILARENEKSRTLRSKLQSAMMYPVFVLTVMFVVGIGTAWYTLPRLAVVLEQMKVELPFYTKMIIDFGIYLKNHGATVIPIIAGTVFVLFFFIFIYKRTKFIGQFLIFHMPIISKAIQEIEISKMGYLLGSLLKAGVPITEALESLANGTTFYSFRRFYRYIERKIDEGNSFRKTFKSYRGSKKFIPLSVQQIIVAAQESGNLASTLQSVGERYETKTDTTAKNLTTVLEPILLVMVAGAVLFFALAVIMPIYQLVGGLNTEPLMATGTNNPAIVASQETSQETHAAAEANQQILIVNNASLNVRSGAGTQNSVIGSVKKDQEFPYTDVQNNWYKITLTDGKEGWVSGQYIKIKPPVINTTATPSTSESVIKVNTDPNAKQQTVTTTRVMNIRSGATTTSNIIGQTKNAEKFQVMEKQGDWYRVQLPNGNFGWLSALYVKVSP